METAQEYYEHFSQQCAACERIGCCPKCVNNHMMNVIAKARKETDLSLKKFCDLMIESYSNGGNPTK